MEAELQEIREQQKQTWNKFSSGWKKWDEFTMSWLKPLGDEIIRSLHLKESDIVLDIAAGTGEPGLTIAAAVPDGKVVMTDLAEGMLLVAEENATKRGITNYETMVCDVSELPFEDQSFDAISCRLGFMFFPDMQVAAKEMFRVLKPGGRIATAVWGVPENNFWITAIMGTIHKNMHVATPPPGTPGMFRCGSPGFIMNLLKQAGFEQLSEKKIDGKLNSGSKDNYWNFMNEVAAPVVAAMNKADEGLRSKIKREVFDVVDQRYPDGKAALDYGAIVVSGVKP